MASKSTGSENHHSDGYKITKYLTNGTSHHPPLKKRFVVNDRRSRLPVFQHKERFIRLLTDNQSLVVVGETGSGKTTQIPQWCIDLCTTKTKQLCVACTQPRRIAAMSVAARVAQEMNVTLGHEVGYSVRFESCSSPKTILKYLTDGMLLREAMLDSLLSSYGIIIIDEAHERTLQTEILFGVIKRAMIARNVKISDLPPLKIVIMSATIKAQLFAKYLNSSTLMIEGRQHPVQNMFAEVPQSDLLTSTLITVFQIHRTCDDGDVLVFCSGQDEIQSLIGICKKVLKQAPESLQNLNPLPLYASLPANNQMRVFECDQAPHVNGTGSSNSNGVGHSRPAFIRRVIFATNVAETSITIPNIKYVIDTGKVKCRTYCPKSGLESLKITTISKSQADQRSGRAGRISSGTCYRLYTSEEYEQMSDYPIPEIKRCNLDGAILQMISIGIKEVYSFDFLERPEKSRFKAAISNLLALKAIKVSTVKDAASKEENDTGKESSKNQKKLHRIITDDNLLNLSYDLTNIGKKLCVFPLSPSMSRVLLAANELNCLDEALTIVSLLYIENLFHIPPNKQAQAESMLAKFGSNEGDTIMLLKVFKAFKRTCQLNRAGLKQWCTENFIHAKNLRLARLIRKQLLDLCKTLGMQPSSCGQDTSLVRRALTYGLFNNVATLWNGKYRNKSSDEIYIHPNSCLFKTRPESILYVEIVETNKCYMRNCTLIDMNWVRDISSANINSNNNTNNFSSMTNKSL